MNEGSLTFWNMPDWNSGQMRANLLVPWWPSRWKLWLWDRTPYKRCAAIVNIARGRPTAYRILGPVMVRCLPEGKGTLIVDSALTGRYEESTQVGLVEFVADHFPAVADGVTVLGGGWEVRTEDGPRFHKQNWKGPA